MSAPSVGLWRSNRNDPGKFWSRVQKGDGCWLWKGATQAPGYGRITYQGQVQYTHRLAYRLSFGEIPEGMLVCHRCDNPPCVRPEHLFLGTLTDNLRDASRKGRMHPGSRHGRARLNEADVAWIRVLSAQGESGVSIAGRLEISPNTVYHILHGRTWRHVL